jgi:putative oxidoreductase
LSGVSEFVGWKTRWAAAALFLWMIPVTWVFRNPSGGQDALIHFMKNLAIMGGMLMVFAFGPGAWSAKRSG